MKYSIGMNFIHIISLVIQGIYFKMEMFILLTWKIWKVAQALISAFFSKYKACGLFYIPNFIIPCLILLLQKKLDMIVRYILSKERYHFVHALHNEQT